MSLNMNLPIALHGLGIAIILMPSLAACGGKTDVDASISESSSGGSHAPSPFAAGGLGADGAGAAWVAIGGSGTLATSAGGVNNLGGAGNAATGGSRDCGTAVCGPLSCGSLVDGCGAIINCGFINCSVPICGTVDPNTGVSTPNVCPPCTPTTCAAAGANCGQIPDGCGNVIDCGSCSDPTQCCGCGNPGIANVCGAGSSTSGQMPYSCIAGTQGCLCDSMGNCAPDLACTPQVVSNPSLCCSGTHCTPPNGGQSIGGICAGTSKTPCGGPGTPGITIPAASGDNDNCGYPSDSFANNAFICGINATGGDTVPTQVEVFFNDAHAMTLGCATANNPVSPPTSDPGYVYYPQTGDPSCVDAAGRPIRPSLYVTDISGDATCTVGDQQEGGQGYDPVAVFGTWKSVTNGTPDPDPIGGFNYWNLTSDADMLPASVQAKCPCTAGNCLGDTGVSMGYGAEARFELALLSGHSYRLQIILHDGSPDQNAGESCVIFGIGSGICIPRTCADYPAGTCGPQSDCCAGAIDCGSC